MKKSKLITLAAANSLGTAAYIYLISLIMNNGERIFGSVDNKMVAPVAFLLLFVFSALVTGALILGKPVMMYLDGQKKESLKLLFYTGGGLLILMVLMFVILIITK